MNFDKKLFVFYFFSFRFFTPFSEWTLKVSFLKPTPLTLDRSL